MDDDEKEYRAATRFEINKIKIKSKILQCIVGVLIITTIIIGVICSVTISELINFGSQF